MANSRDHRNATIERIRQIAERLSAGHPAAHIDVRLDDDGDQVVEVVPARPKAASIVFRMTTPREVDYVIYAFIADSFTPIEISAPVDMNHGRPYRLAVDLVAGLLEAVARADLIAENGPEGGVLRVYVPSLFPEERVMQQPDQGQAFDTWS